MRGMGLVMALGAISAMLAPLAAKAESQVLTTSQMDAVTAAGVVHLNMPISVIVLNITEVSVTADVVLGDSDNETTISNGVPVAATATIGGTAVCAICWGSFPQVVSSAIVLNNYFSLQALP